MLGWYYHVDCTGAEIPTSGDLESGGFLFYTSSIINLPTPLPPKNFGVWSVCRNFQ